MLKGRRNIAPLLCLCFMTLLVTYRNIRIFDDNHQPVTFDDASVRAVSLASLMKPHPLSTPSPQQLLTFQDCADIGITLEMLNLANFSGRLSERCDDDVSTF
jgi:hypothetical protein